MNYDTLLHVCVSSERRDYVENRQDMWLMVAPWLNRATDDRQVAGSNHTGAAWKLWTIFFTTLCHCLSEGTLKAAGPFYLVLEYYRKKPYE